MFLVTDAHAQTAAAAAAPNDIMAQLFGGPASPLVMMGLMFGILYLMVIRPQNQERKKLEQSIAKLSKGDRVLTTSGIVATVNRLKDANIVLEIADGVQVEFTRSAIAQVLDGGDRK